MSRITPKNLSYDTTLPPFLQRMQQANTGLDGRHERAIARPRKAKNADDEEDDAPTYVDEDTNHTLSKEEYAALVKSDEQVAEEAPVKANKDISEADDNEVALKKEKVAVIGPSKKRPIGKVVGVDESEDTTVSEDKQKHRVSIDKKSDTLKPKKKSKKIKLSFNDDEG